MRVREKVNECINRALVNVRRSIRGRKRFGGRRITGGGGGGGGGGGSSSSGCEWETRLRVAVGWLRAESKNPSKREKGQKIQVGRA